MHSQTDNDFHRSPEESIPKLLSVYQGEIIDMCYFFYKMVEEDGREEQAAYFRSLCENFGNIKSNETYAIPSYISERERDLLRDQYGDYVDEVLNSLIKKSYIEQYSEAEFYQRLWKIYLEGGLLTDEKEIVFAIYYVIIDRKIPYFTLEQGMTMENEEYHNYTLLLASEKDKLRFILNHGFSQKTEEASLILKEISQLESFEEQTVAMSLVLSILRADQKVWKRRLERLLEESS